MNLEVYVFPGVVTVQPGIVCSNYKVQVANLNPPIGRSRLPTAIDGVRQRISARSPTGVGSTKRLKFPNINIEFYLRQLAARIAEMKTIQSIKPTIRQYWLTFSILAFAVFLAFEAFGVTTITGQSILSVSGILTVHIFLSVFTSKYVVTDHGVLIRNGPFLRKFREVTYGEIHSITIKQGRMQKRFKIGSLIIRTESVSRVLNGIKHPNQTKELINREKAAEYERRTLLRKML